MKWRKRWQRFRRRLAERLRYPGAGSEAGQLTLGDIIVPTGAEVESDFIGPLNPHVGSYPTRRVA